MVVPATQRRASKIAKELTLLDINSLVEDFTNMFEDPDYAEDLIVQSTVAEVVEAMLDNGWNFNKKGHQLKSDRSETINLDAEAT